MAARARAALPVGCRVLLTGSGWYKDECGTTRTISSHEEQGPVFVDADERTFYVTNAFEDGNDPYAAVLIKFDEDTAAEMHSIAIDIDRVAARVANVATGITDGLTKMELSNVIGKLKASASQMSDLGNGPRKGQAEC